MHHPIGEKAASKLQPQPPKFASGPCLAGVGIDVRELDGPAVLSSSQRCRAGRRRSTMPCHAEADGILGRIGPSS